MSPEYRAQRRIGVLISAFAFVMTVFNVVDGIRRSDSPEAILFSINVWLVFLTGVAILVLSRIDSPLARLIFAGLFFMTDVIASIDDPNRNITFWFALMGGVCLYKFGFLTRYTILKTLLIFVLLCLAAFFGHLYRNLSYVTPTAIANLVLTAVSLGFIYIAFAEEILDLKDLNHRVSEELKNNQTLLEMNKPFVEFGRNTAGVVHDLRGDLNTIFLSIQSLQHLHARNKKPEKIDLELIERAVRRLNQRIDLVRYVASAMPERPEETVELAWIVESALYPFTISPKWRNKVEFKTSFEGDLTIWGKRVSLLRIAENLISNSCEAFIEERHLSGLPQEMKDKSLLGRLSVTGTGRADTVELGFADNGPGIPSCKLCDGKRCMECTCFAIGRSSKTDGSGFGMMNVRDIVRSFGGSMSIVTSQTGGTTIAIVLPRKQVLQTPGDEPGYSI